MELKEIILLAIAFLGWTWGVFQYFINRKLQNKEKLADRRFEVYSGYLKKSDELMSNVRSDPNMIYGISSDFMKAALTGDEEQLNQALLDFNEKLQEFVQKASEPLMILNQELSTLLLVSSSELSTSLNQLKILVADLNIELQNVLGTLSSGSADDMQNKLATMGHDKRWRRFEDLNNEILSTMRKELGYESLK